MACGARDLSGARRGDARFFVGFESMRIIAGEFRGRRIEAPPGDGTRPMLDRVREALFSTLGERVDGARVLDLFAGSGSLGLEALSRGARVARMVEQHPRAYATLKENVELLGAADRALCARGNDVTSDHSLRLRSSEIKSRIGPSAWASDAASSRSSSRRACCIRRLSQVCASLTAMAAIQG